MIEEIEENDDGLPESPEFWQGIEQFNQHQFYDCHDTLEALWMEAVEPQRSFYQGILQIAVALHHLGNQNFRGAIILLGEGMNRLRHYQPTFAGIHVAHLLERSRRLQTKLQQAQAAELAEQLSDLSHQVHQGQAASDLPTIERVARDSHPFPPES
jgi:predicted metal-dependent hydrolase